MWFPERDPTANPSDNGTLGFWGPWMKSTANKAILQKVLDTIPSVSEKKHSCHTNCKNKAKKIGKVFSTHEESDKEVYKMLETILEMANKGKKGQIPRNSRLMKESLAMLFAKMKQKTKVDDLMHKLQMIKKNQVTKRKGRKGHTSEESVKERTRASTLSRVNSSSDLNKSKKVADKTHHSVNKIGTRRTEIENVAIKDDSSLKNGYGFEVPLEKNSNWNEEDQNMEEISSLVKSSGAKEDRQNDIESDDLMEDNSDNEKNTDIQIDDNIPEEESADQSSDTSEQTSEEGSGSESQDFTDVSDDVNGDNNDSNWDDKRNTIMYL